MHPWYQVNAQNGYLGLILAAPAYAVIVDTDTTGAPEPFIAPTFPGTVPKIVGINEIVREAELCKFEADSRVGRKLHKHSSTQLGRTTSSTDQQRRQKGSH
jgi:hypothetical protein